MNILLVEDEPKIEKFLVQGLRSEGFNVTVSHEGHSGEALALSNTFDLFILDVMLPGKDGIQICKTIRENAITSPIIFLTAKDAVSDRILGLDSGADDYLTKPFSFQELLARIRALLRRSRQFDRPGLLHLGDLEMNTETFEVKRSGKDIRLSATEFKLLRFLLENQHRVVSKAIILESVWGFAFSPESNIVEVYINYLREKIDKPFPVHLIQTVHGLGYRICD